MQLQRGNIYMVEKFNLKIGKEKYNTHFENRISYMKKKVGSLS